MPPRLIFCKQKKKLNEGSFPILQTLTNGVTVKTEEYRIPDVNSKNDEEQAEERPKRESPLIDGFARSAEVKEGYRVKPNQEEHIWEHFPDDDKLDIREKEDIDQSRYVIVVENQNSRERLERLNLKKNMADGGNKKRQRPSTRRDHGVKKKGKKNFTCDICREELTNEEELEGHRRNRHINEKSEFFCDFCLKIFKTKAILKGHRYKHITDPQFLCVRCGKKYFTISNLNEHSLYCLDEKKFECPVCYKKFNVNKQLKRHLVIHEADRYIKCTVCEQTFSRKDNYRQHFRRHTNEKPYTCDICGKSFRIKATYNYHKRTHRDLRPSDVEVSKVEPLPETEFNTFRSSRKDVTDGFFQGTVEDGPSAFGGGLEQAANTPPGGMIHVPGRLHRKKEVLQRT